MIHHIGPKAQRVLRNEIGLPRILKYINVTSDVLGEDLGVILGFMKCHIRLQ